MPLSDIVTLSIAADSARVTQQGFGIPLILSPRPTWTERTRVYEALADLVTDGFVAGTPEYIAASRIFAQDRSVEELIVGRCSNAPTQKWTFIPTAADARNYTIHLKDEDGNEEDATFLSGSSATVASITTGLKAAVDALEWDIEAARTDTEFTLTAEDAGIWYSVEVDNVALLSVVQDHADPGVDDDLDAIKNETDAFYGIVHLFNSSECVKTIASWTESNKKLFVAQVQDTPIIGTAKSGTDDIAEFLQSSNYKRTAPIYHPATYAFADSGWEGKCLPLQPGSETWMFKTLAGVPAVGNLTPTHRTRLREKGCNFYEPVAGVAIAEDGVTSQGQYIDTTRGLDWLEARLGERIFGLLARSDKLPYTPRGVQAIAGEVLAQLREAVNVGLLSDSPAPTVTVPKVADISSSDKLARLLPSVKFTAVGAGAIHKVQIQGNVSF